MSNLFQPITNTTAYLKAGFLGKQGAGKSATAAFLTIGLIQHLKQIGVPYANKPVFFYDTEKGSNWLIKHFDAAGIPLMRAETRLFSDLVTAVKVAEQEASALIIDSITHPWQELLDSYMKKKQRSFMQIDDWQYVKGAHGWKQFADPFLNSKLNIIICGRAADETEQYTDDNGKRQFEKVGIKMKTENDTGYEPSLLVLMQQDTDLRTKIITNKAVIQKDRSMLIHGHEFHFETHDSKGNVLPTDTLVRQTFAAFAPHIKDINFKGEHIGLPANGDSTHILKTEKKDWAPVQREIVLDEISDLLTMYVPGQAVAEKQRRIKLLHDHFSAGWKEIEKTMDLLCLRAGYDGLHQELTGKPSRYTGNMEAEKVPLELNDDIPDHSKAPAPAKAVTTAEAA